MSRLISYFISKLYFQLIGFPGKKNMSRLPFMDGFTRANIGNLSEIR